HAGDLWRGAGRPRYRVGHYYHGLIVRQPPVHASMWPDADCAAVVDASAAICAACLRSRCVVNAPYTTATLTKATKFTTAPSCEWITTPTKGSTTANATRHISVLRGPDPAFISR